jgi:pyridoxal phosphate enzyme (YggS family)
MGIAENLLKINKEIEKAAKKSGRTKDDISLVAVTKTKPLQTIKDLIELGIRDFGENRVQELSGKMDSINEDVRWHMIGHLQKNKVKYLVDNVYMIHSVDSLELAKEISKRAIQKNKKIKILLQLNISGEETKYGLTVEKLIEMLPECSEMNGVEVCGLMTMAPFYAENRELKAIFSKMSQLRVDIKAKNMDNIGMQYLSMGMSNDYIIAIEEGANMVRIGSALLD